MQAKKFLPLEETGKTVGEQRFEKGKSGPKGTRASKSRRAKKANTSYDETSPPGSPKVQIRTKWSFEEEEAFIAAYVKYGHGKWAEMLTDPFFGNILCRRNNVNLKDKARTMIQQGKLVL